MKRLTITQEGLLLRAKKETLVEQSDCRTADSLVSRGMLEFVGGKPNNRPTAIFKITALGDQYIENLKN